MGEMHDNPAHVRLLEEWMKGYRPEDLFDDGGRLKPELADLAPEGSRRMSANPHGNGGAPPARPAPARLPGLCRRREDAGRGHRRVHPRDGPLPPRRDEDEPGDAELPPLQPGREQLEPVAGRPRGHQPRLGRGDTFPYDDHLAPDGRVMEMLSEHQCQGWLEGYLLTGRHGFFSCYEAFIHIVDSMFNQHAKWLKVCNHIPWRRPIASLNYLLSSHVWRQDHNGFSHQDPGFIDHVVNKKAEVVRVYLPPDANCLLSVTDHCLRSRNYVNVVVAGKQPAPQWLTMDEAVKHCTAGLGIWEWASSDKGSEPDVVMACCGDVPTLETLAAVDLLRRHAPELRVRVINVVNLMTLQTPRDHLSRALRPRLRRALHHRQAGHLRLPRLSLADPPADVPAKGSPELPRARLPGGGDHDHAVRHVRAERPGPLPPGAGRDRPGAEARRAGRLRQTGDPRPAPRAQGVHRPARRRHARDHRLEVGAGGRIRRRPLHRGGQRVMGAQA